MSLYIVLVRHDAEKLKFFSFVASLKNACLVTLEKTLAIYGSRQLGGKKNATSVNLPLIESKIIDKNCEKNFSKNAREPTPSQSWRAGLANKSFSYGCDIGVQVYHSLSLYVTL